MGWQWEQIIRPWYGSRNEDGSQQKQTALIFVPKKQNKSGLVALLALFHIMAEVEAGLCYVLASKVSQAKVLFNFAANTIRYGRLKTLLHSNKKTKQRIKIKDHLNEIVYTSKESVQSTIKIMPFTPEGVSGPSASLVIWDEICEYPQIHARTIWDLLQGSTAARHGKHIVISTPHFNKETLGGEKWQLAKDLLDGTKEDETILPLIYGIPENAKCDCGENHAFAWQCPKWWRKVNPSMGITVPEAFYYNEYRKTQNSPLNEAAFRTLYCGEWVGHLEQFISQVSWDACKANFIESDFYGSDAFIGMDLARKGDTASYCLLIPKEDKVFILPRFFIPQENALQKEKTDRTPYTRYEKQGYIELTSGDVIDYSRIRQSIMRDADNFNILEIRFDPYACEETRQLLEEEGFYMVEAKQSFNVMSPATAYFERLVIDKKIRHNNHPILNSHLQNATVRKNGEDQILLDKRRSTGRIDGLTAVCIGLLGIMAGETENDLFVGLL